MDGTLFDDSEEKAQQVNEILARHPLPSILADAEAKPGWTWDGDPITWIWVRQAHDDAPSPEEMHGLHQFMSSVKADVKALPDWQLAMFRFLPAKLG